MPSSTTSAACAPAAPRRTCSIPIQVDAYGATMPINQVATVNVPEPRLLSVQVWDRGMVGGGRKGDPRIRSRPQPADRGPGHPPAHPRDERAAPQGNGQGRAQICRGGRVAVRHVRRDGLDLLKKLEKDGAHRRGRREAPGRSGAEGDRPDRRRGRQAARGQGKGNHAGLSAGPARKSDHER